MQFSRRVVAMATLALIGAAGTALVAARMVKHDADAAGRPASPSTAAGRPKAVMDRTSYDVGSVDPEDTLYRTFVIRNQGTAPLTVDRAQGTCSCTITDLPKTPIPPGGCGELQVGFKPLPTPQEGNFGRIVSVATNDPTWEKISLRIEGVIRHRLAAAPARLTMRVDAVETKRSAEVVVFSQRWQQFRLAVAKTSLAGMECRLEPASAARLKALDALAGYRLEIEMPPDMPEGRFAESIELCGEAADAGERPRTLRLEVQGKVDGRLSIHGPKLDDDKTLHLGAIRAGEAVHENLVMKVHDELRRLKVQTVESQPRFVQARVVPYASGTAERGLYRLEIEIPPSAPSCNCMGAHAAAVRMKTDHPRLPVIEVKVEFAVVGG